MTGEMVLDGAVASEPSKRPPLWDVREKITEALKRDGYVYKYDISLPLKDLYSAVEDTRELLRGKSETQIVHPSKQTYIVFGVCICTTNMVTHTWNRGIRIDSFNKSLCTHTELWLDKAKRLYI